MNTLLNRTLWTLLLGVLLTSCQQTYWEDDLTPANLNAVGKLFMEVLEKSPEAYQTWCSTPNVRNVSPNEVALLSGGDYGLHYALPLVSGNTIIGFIIFPIEGYQNDSQSWHLKKPIIKEGQAIEDDAAFIGIMRTKAFAKWQSQNLKVSQALQDAYNSRSEIFSKSICLTRSSSGGWYYCVYELEFENYVNEFGEVVAVGMDWRTLDNICSRIIDMLPQSYPITYTIDKSMLQFNCTEEAFDLILTKLKEELEEQHVSFWIIYAGGRDDYGREYDGTWAHYNSGGGTSSGGGGGDSLSVSITNTMKKVEDILAGMNLDEELKKALYDFFELRVRKYPRFKSLIPLLYGINLSIEVNPDKLSPKAGIEYDKEDNKIYLFSIKQLEGDGLIEELIHFLQFNPFNERNYPLKNIEFEAKACYDLFLYPHGNHGNLRFGLPFDYERFERFMAEYKDNNYKMNDKLWKDYHDLGELWDDPYYHNVNGYTESKYNRDLPPAVFEYIFN